MGAVKVVEVPISGMDCAECALHVQKAIAEVPGVARVAVYLAAEKAVIDLDRGPVDMPAIRQAVERAGYSVAETDGAVAATVAGAAESQPASPPLLSNFTNRILGLFGIVFGAVLLIVVAGEWLGVFAVITAQVPWIVGAALVALAGYPVFRNVLQATLQRRVTSHTLMSLGVIAALAIGEWATAAVVVFFMRVGDYAESFTTERARRAVKDLAALAPQTARVERGEQEETMPITAVMAGDVVVVRPGEKIPVDGKIIEGQATVNQATLTGESLPVEAGPGMQVYAATFAQLGSLRIRATHVGRGTKFGRVIQLVQEAEAHRADVERIADKFSGYYLPVVAGLAALTLLIRHDPLATAAVLVVACSCAFALATPIAMLASVGAAARQGILVKGGKYLESLARVDVVLIDKTGTLTLGRPQITDIQPLNGASEEEMLVWAASAERYSEHPLAEAVRQAARDRHLSFLKADNFEATPGIGVRAQIDGRTVTVSNGKAITQMRGVDAAHGLEAEGKSLLFVTRDAEMVGVMAAADVLRPEVPAAIKALRQMGIRQIELLTGDHERAALSLAQTLGIEFRANLLPEDKIRIVKAYQAQGRTVVMVGDGVNDAPALAQANVGIAMGTAGADIAIEAAHVALLRDDWMLIPEALRIARRTMGVVKLNIGFTAVYNVVGLSLAAVGILPPVLAAAAQSLPDLGILANSARLLRPQRKFESETQISQMGKSTG